MITCLSAGEFLKSTLTSLSPLRAFCCADCSLLDCELKPHLKTTLQFRKCSREAGVNGAPSPLGPNFQGPGPDSILQFLVAAGDPLNVGGHRGGQRPVVTRALALAKGREIDFPGCHFDDEQAGPYTVGSGYVFPGGHEKGARRPRRFHSAVSGHPAAALLVAGS